MTHDRGTVAPTIAAVLMAVMGTLLSSVVDQLRNICDVESYDRGVADETYVAPGSPRSGWAITTPLIATLTGGLTPTLTVISRLRLEMCPSRFETSLETMPSTLVQPVSCRLAERER